MKNLFTLLCLAALTNVATAQDKPLVFTYENGPKEPSGTDVIYGTELTSIAPNSLPVAQQHLWDLSTMVLASYTYNSIWAKETSFTGATHSNIAYVDIAPGVSYQTQLMVSIDTTGIKTIGERLNRQAFQVGTNQNDSIVVLKQDVVYGTPQIRMPYPATIGTKWNATTNAAYDLSITATLPSPLPPLNNAPGQRKSIITSTHEVVGWGVMRVKRTDGKAAGVRAVLQVQNTITTVDSFYINGSPAPAPLLQAAGIQQGETNTVYQRTFWRQWEVMPLLNVTYQTAAFASMKDVNVHTNRLPYPDNVEEINGISVAEIYPNPNSGEFSVKVPDAGNSDWTYSVVDMTGKTVKTGALNIDQQVARVSLTGAVTPGSYFVHIAQDGQTVSGQKIIVQ